MKKVVRFVSVLMLIVMLSSCAMLEGVLGEMGLGGLGKALFNKYPANTVALDAIFKGAANFDDVGIADRWGLVWNGLFSAFYETNKSDSMPDMYRLALAKGLGIKPALYSEVYHEREALKDYSTGDITGYTEAYTSYSFRVENKEDLQKLAGIAMELIEAQTDPEVAIKWLEDLYAEIEKTDGNYNGFALVPYLSEVDGLASRLFENGLAPEQLSENSFGAKAAKLYVENYPDGYFIEYAKARQQASAGTDDNLVL